MNLTEDVVRVRLENPEDISIVRTEEHEPEYFTFSTVVVAGNVNGVNKSEMVGSLDLLRKEISILAVDSPVVVCHSQNQLSDPANQAVGVPFPQGAYLPTGASLTLKGTGPLWVVATVATASRVSVALSRRQLPGDDM